MDYEGHSNKQLNPAHNDFVEWNLEFVRHIVNYMREVECPSH